MMMPPSLPTARGVFCIGLLMRPVACLPAYLKGQTHSQDPLKVACPLPEGFDRVDLRVIACLSGMSTRQRARQSTPPSITTTTACPMTYSLVPIGAPGRTSPVAHDPPFENRWSKKSSGFPWRPSETTRPLVSYLSIWSPPASALARS